VLTLLLSLSCAVSPAFRRVHHTLGFREGIHEGDRSKASGAAGGGAVQILGATCRARETGAFPLLCSDEAPTVGSPFICQAAIIYAEGEAEAATLISQAVKSAGSGMIEVKRIDVRWWLPPIDVPFAP
jgi:hypothetical protein